MNKTAIKNYAVWARVQLIGSAKQRAYEYGVTENGPNDPGLDSIGGRLLTKTEKDQRRQLIAEIERKGYTQVMEEAAYTWFNRFIALRYMEVNGYLPSRTRVFTDENGEFKPEILKQAMSVDLEGLDRDKVFDLLDKQNNEELYKYLLITQCNALNAGLPYMFEKIANWTELLFPSNLLRQDSVLGRLISEIPLEDWNDEVEIIGWFYQYYISEKHDEVVDPLHGKVVKKEDIPAATQLFTTDWVVRYILDNSLGRYWIERRPESKLAEKLAYFVTPKDGIIPAVNESILPEELKVLDPCVGSGHFLSYAFDILLEIYRECGWSDRDAAKSILENNLYGLDIDDRAAQLACFAVMMKARKYNRRIISPDTKLNIMAMQDSEPVSDDLIRFVAGNDMSVRQGLNELRILFSNAKEYGSIIEVPKIDLQPLYRREEEIKSAYIDNLMDVPLQAETTELVLPLIRQAEILAGKYDVVATNPPYLNKYSPRLKDYIAQHYGAYKGDLFSVFMYRNFGFCKPNGYSGFMTPNVWMFIKSYEELRIYIISNKAITTLVQMAKGAFFKEATVDICAFVLSNKNADIPGSYIRLEDFKGDMDIQRQKVEEAISDRNCGYFYEADESNFSKIPGSPVAYWVSPTLFNIFETKPSLAMISKPKTGMRTGDNERFLRIWHEVQWARFAQSCSNKDEALMSKAKWFPYNKGGDFRAWYGNNSIVVNWENDGEEIKENTRRVYPQLGENLSWKITNEQDYFKEGITWTALTSSSNSFRYSPTGFIFDSNKGPMLFADDKMLHLLLGLLTSIVAKYILIILNPTLSLQNGDLEKLPIVLPTNTDNMVQLVGDSIAYAKDDWDSFETSWDFKKHPLI